MAARWAKLTLGRGDCSELPGPSALRAHSYVGLGSNRVRSAFRSRGRWPLSGSLPSVWLTGKGGKRSIA